MTSSSEVHLINNVLLFSQIVEFDNLPPEEMAKYSRVYPAAEERLKEGKVHYSAEKYRAALKSFRFAAR